MPWIGFTIACALSTGLKRTPTSLVGIPYMGVRFAGAVHYMDMLPQVHVLFSCADDVHLLAAR